MRVYVFEGIIGCRSLFLVEAENEAEARDKLLNNGDYTTKTISYKNVVSGIELNRIDNLTLRDCPYCGEATHFVEVNTGEKRGYSVACSTEGCFCHAGTFSTEIRKCYSTCKAAADAWNAVPSKTDRSEK